ncbi:hypothetical protein DHEL01_v213129, partial [Diaporthe helianthi]
SEVEGLRLETWLLEERWPGVWLRGTGGARSGADESWWPSYRGRGVGTSARSEEGEGGGDWPEVAADIFWERTIFDLRGDVCLSSLGLAAWSAIVEEPPQKTMRQRERDKGQTLRLGLVVLTNWADCRIVTRLVVVGVGVDTFAVVFCLVVEV